MNLFKRLFFFALCAGMPVSIIGMHLSGGSGFPLLACRICHLGMIIWCICYLKSEPSLARTGLIIFLADIVASMLFAPLTS